MGNLKFTPYHFEQIIKKGFSMDQIVLITWIHKGIDLSDLINCGSIKVVSLYHSLLRKGLITEDGTKLTSLGKELLLYMDTKDASKFVKKKPASTDFDLWWTNYPGTDTFKHKGISFQGSRSLRTAKDACRLKFTAILEEGEHTVTDMINALKFDVLQKKENSVKLKTNKLTYMQNSLTYLNQRSYEPFIELIKDGVTITEASGTPRGGTDI